MRNLWSALFVLLVVCLVFPAPGAFADEDAADFRATVRPGFVSSGQAYAKFETEELPIEPALNNFLAAVDLDKSPTAVVRSYVRVRYADEKVWSRYNEFDGEFHFASTREIDAYQMCFIVRDESKGSSRINRFTVQGKSLNESTMKWLLAMPAPFKATKLFPKPTIVSREEWGARKPKHSYTPHRPLRIVLHHSWIPNQSQYKGATSIRGIQNYHMDGEATGWSDIGYHFLIGPDGLIFQGRPETVVGAHASPNTNAVGICIIGDYDPNKDQLNDKIETSLLNLLSWLSSKYGIDPREQYFGHRDYSPKSCPGDTVYERLPQYRKIVLDNIGKK